MDCPKITVVAGAMRHVTVDRALRLLGVGTGSVVEVAADDQGRMRADALAETLASLSGPLIVCAQAGEVNTGSFDPLFEIVELSHQAGAWLHVDGAFGLWAAASPTLRGLVEGVERADSWAFDGHKWLNVPYDCGVAGLRAPGRAPRRDGHHRVLSARGGRKSQHRRLDAGGIAAPAGHDGICRLEISRAQGVADLVDRCCAHARRFAAGVSELPGCEVLNEVVLNQVLFRFADDQTTQAAMEWVQRSARRGWGNDLEWPCRNSPLRLELAHDRG